MDRKTFFKSAKPAWGSTINGWPALQKTITETDKKGMSVFSWPCVCKLHISIDFPFVLDTPTQRGATCRLHCISYRAVVYAYYDKSQAKLEKKLASYPELVVPAKDLVAYNSTLPRKIHTHGLGSSASALIGASRRPLTPALTRYVFRCQQPGGDIGQQQQSQP